MTHSWKDEYDKAAVKINLLREALAPFQRNIYAESIIQALGHIGREDLERARRAYEQ